MAMDNKVKEILARNVQYYFKKSNLTRGEFANRIGMTEQAVSKWISRGDAPSIDSLDKVAMALGVQIKDLFEERPGLEHSSDQREFDRIRMMMGVRADAKAIIEYMLDFSSDQLFLLRENTEAIYKLWKERHFNK